MLTRLGFTAQQFRLTADGQSAAEEIQRENTPPARQIPCKAHTDSGSNNNTNSASKIDNITMIASDGTVTMESLDNTVDPGTSLFPCCAPWHPYTLVLMDLQMPICDGFSSTSLIRSMNTSIHQPYICALTANAMEGDAEQCLAHGMDAYLSKPINIHTIIQTMNQAAQQQIAQHAT